MPVPPNPRVTFRYEAKGGDVRVRPLACPGHALNGSHLVLLIHGFNNNEKDARDAYDGFCRQQRRLGGLADDQPVADGRLVELFWPGDVGWFPAKNYEDSLHRVIRAVAPRLAAAFARAVRQSGPKEVDVVAHSMGCRLTLELISRFRLVPGVHLRRVVFFAAAIPTFLLDPPERLRASLDHPDVQGVLSLYSPDDAVLDYAFPAGQWDAQGEAWTEGDEWRRGQTVALGLQEWIPRQKLAVLSQSPVTGADHSDYWGYKENSQSLGEEANRKAKEFLRFTAAGSRQVVERQVADRPGAPTRSEETERALPSRSTASPGCQSVEI